MQLSRPLSFLRRHYKFHGINILRVCFRQILNKKNFSSSQKFFSMDEGEYNGEMSLNGLYLIWRGRNIIWQELGYVIAQDFEKYIITNCRNTLPEMIVKKYQYNLEDWCINQWSDETLWYYPIKWMTLQGINKHCLKIGTRSSIIIHVIYKHCLATSQWGYDEWVSFEKTKGIYLQSWSMNF